MLARKRDFLSLKIEENNKAVQGGIYDNEFLTKKKYQTVYEKRKSINCKNYSLTCIAIKVLWTVFIALYLIEVFEILSVIKEIWEEFYSMTKLFFFKKQMKSQPL